MPAPNQIIDLVSRFDTHRDAYRSGRYKETQLRREFIDPFFIALGWDVENKKGYAEAYKEVIHEDAIKVGGATKAPDYSFRIGPVRKFFVETKKPSVDIAHDIHPAFQLRRYAWSAKLPLSILTDFEEFAVYDCRIKPMKTDKASTARVLYCKYQEYENRWDEIETIFSHEEVLKGSFDKYAESTLGKRGTAEVDDAFLKEIEGWRESLARNFALRNALTHRELNFAVQRTIDRIIFLRICEDRGIEEYGRLMSLQNGQDTYQRLGELLLQADARYDSGLFHFKEEKDQLTPPDELTLGLNLDDKPLKEIILDLYYPDSPYEFSVLPADILGQVYEQFLGKVIRLTPSGHRAVVEDKPEVKKAGGVYYTPTYIVDYIVENTVGKLLEGKTPWEVGGESKARSSAPIRILDPACGSGSFLIAAYQYLLNWYRDRYAEEMEQGNTSDNKLRKIKKRVYQGTGNDWRLTTTERKRILLNHIYGVDIDSQAVEVTKLSLLLKVLEGETEESLQQQLQLFRERALPDLAENIRCGNSLIGPDYFANMLIPDTGELERVNPFDWGAEFSDTVLAGGFDAVISNPPYGMVTDEEFKAFFGDSYKATEGRFDTYELFIEKGIKLCREQGLLGYIVPNPLLSNLYARELRRYILENCMVREITNLGMDVFADPTIHTCIIIVSRGLATGLKIKIRKQVTSIQQLLNDYDYELPQLQLGNNLNSTFDIFMDPTTQRLVGKLHAVSRSLGDICFIRQCIKTGDNKKYLRSTDATLNDPWKPSLTGRSIGRYVTFEKNLFVKYGPWLARNWKNKSFYETPKIVVRETGKRIIATIDLDNRYVLSTLYAVYPKAGNKPESLSYLLGLLNSRLSTYFIKVVAFDLTMGAFTKVRTNQLARLPVRTINFEDSADVTRHDKMVALVERMLELHKRLQSAITAHDKKLNERQIETTDQQIDALVYELYGLTEDEIGLVEKGMIA